MATLKTAIEKIHEDTPAKLAKDLWDCQRLFLCSFDGAPKEYKKLLAIRLKEFEHRLDLLRCRTDILLPRLPYKEKETDGDRAVRIYDWCVAAIPIWKSQEVLPKENTADLPGKNKNPKKYKPEVVTMIEKLRAKKISWKIIAIKLNKKYTPKPKQEFTDEGLRTWRKNQDKS